MHQSLLSLFYSKNFTAIFIHLDKATQDSNYRFLKQANKQYLINFYHCNLRAYLCTLPQNGATGNHKLDPGLPPLGGSNPGYLGTPGTHWRPRCGHLSHSVFCHWYSPGQTTAALQLRPARKLFLWSAMEMNLASCTL